MLNLSSAALIESRKLHSDGAWLILLELSVEGSPVYLVRNTESIIWNSITWNAFPFEIDDIKEESSGELPSVTLRVSNVTRALQSYLEQYDGLVGTIVTFRIVHANHLDLTSPELEEVFTINSTKADKDWVYFELGMGEPVFKRFPPRRYLKNFCPFKFKGIECGVPATVSGTYCTKNLEACRYYNNSTRFGGFPSIPQGGIYV